jgi:hypothetical protein
MECNLVFLVYFRLLKFFFHVFSIILTQGDLFLNLRVFNVRMYHWHSLITIISWNYLITWICWTFIYDNTRWIMCFDLKYCVWYMIKQCFGDIFHPSFYKNTKTMFLSFVSGIIFECDKFQRLHFNYLSYVLVTSN